MSEKKSPKYFSQKAKKKKSVVVILEKIFLKYLARLEKTYCINTFWLPRGGEKYAQICFWSNCFLKKLGKMFICICFVLIFGFIAHILSKYLGNDFQITHCCVKKCCDE